MLKENNHQLWNAAGSPSSYNSTTFIVNKSVIFRQPQLHGSCI